MTELLKTLRVVKLSLVRETVEPYTSAKQIRHGGDVASLIRSLIGDDPREVFCAVYLDAKHKVIAAHRISTGTADASPVHPREVFGPALQLAASGVVVSHNHPSGDPTPSATDRSVTERLKQCGELLGVPLLDHVVIGHGKYHSIADDRSFAF